MRTVAFAGEDLYTGAMPVKFGDSDKLTAADAARELGVKRWKLFQLVKDGLLERHVDDFASLGWYSRTEVLALKRMRQESRKSSAAQSEHSN